MPKKAKQTVLGPFDIHRPWTICIDWRIMFSNYFSGSAFKSKVSIKDKFQGVKDWYNNIHITKGIFFCFYCRRSCYLYISQDVCFCFTRKKLYCCYSYNFVKVRESPGISSKVLEKSWNSDAKSPGKSKKKSWKVLESPGISINFFDGNHDLT